jgi:hypothetical protein
MKLEGSGKQEDDDPTGWKTARELIGCIAEKPIAGKVSEDHDRWPYPPRPVGKCCG